MADKRAFFKVDVGYLMNPKIAALAAESPTAVLLHLAAIGYAAQHLTDGVAPLALVQRIAGATERDAELCFKRSLLIDRHDGDVEVHDYLEHQRSAAEAKRLSDAGKKGAESRWQSDSDADRIADRNAGASADRMRTPMAREREEREREEQQSAPADAADATPSKPSRRKPERPLPEAWKPTEKHAAQAAQRGVDVEAEARAFRNHAATHDRRARDWDAAFRTWLDRARPMPGRPGGGHPGDQLPW